MSEAETVDHAKLLTEYGLDQPIIVQYGIYIGKVLHGDLGKSIITQAPVLSEFASLFPATIELAVCAILFALLIGIPAGILAAVKRNSWLDHGVMGVSLAGYSMPIFWWGLLLILLFSVQLDLTPVSGRIAVEYFFDSVTGFLLIDSLLSGQKGAFLSTVSHLILPTIVLGTNPLAVIARMTRSAMLEVLGEDYIRTARAKGLPMRTLVLRHAMKPALLPVVSLIGPMAISSITSAVVTESVFSLPGLGKLIVTGASNRDYTLVLGLVVLVTVFTVVFNLLVDLAYALLDPKIRY